jgi:hypothetical protein
MKKFLSTILLFPLFMYGQTFTHSGRIFNANGSGVQDIQVNLYQRTTPNIVGFTQQTNYNGHSYYRSTSSMTWTNARQACLNMGGHLVTITSSGENNFVFNTWPSGWIGFTDEAVEGQWKWVTNEPVTYTNWNGGEPNNAGNEDYAQFVGGGRWNDLPNLSLPYVLEFEYIVTTTPWTVVSTSTTNSTGNYSFSISTDPSKEYYIEIITPTTNDNFSSSDFVGIDDVVLNRTSLKSFHYHQYDLNNDNKITISDLKFLSNILNGSQSWTNQTLLFTSSQWSTLSNGTVSYKSSIPGVTGTFTFTPTSGGVTNFYLLTMGFTNQSLIQYQ